SMSILNKYIIVTWTFARRVLVIALIGIGHSIFLTESVLSQPIIGSSKKDWQFDNLSGTPVWIISNEAIGNPPLQRVIYILVESKYFKREVLTQIFTGLSRKITDVNWITIEAYSDKEILRQMIIIDRISGADIDWRTLTNGEKKSLGLPVNPLEEKERVL